MKFSTYAEAAPILSKTKPWPHQAEAFQFSRNQIGVLLAMDMGTGKSKVAIDLIVNWHARRALVICPVSVLDVWPTQFQTHASWDGVVLKLGKGTSTDKAKEAKGFIAACEQKGVPAAIVVSYDSAWRDQLGELLLKTSWDVVAFDESHRIKNPAGRASMFCSRLGNFANRRVALTGTPMPHSPLDIFAQARAIRPEIFGNNFHQFKNRYVRFGGFQNREIVGWRNQDGMKAKMNEFVFRADKSLLSLPEYMHVTRFCDLEPDAVKKYRDMEKSFAIEVADKSMTIANALVRMLRLQQLTGGWLAIDDGSHYAISQAKISLFSEILDDLPKDEKIVAFARFRNDLSAIRRVGAEKGRQVWELSGQAHQLAQWQSSTTPDLLAVQIQSGGVGVDMTMARYCIYYSLGFSLGEYEQSLARTHRPGQRKNVVYIHLLCRNTIDEDVYAALRKKKEVVAHVLEAVGKPADQRKLIEEPEAYEPPDSELPW